MKLSSLAARLRQPALMRLADSFSERKIAYRRTFVIMILTLWAAAWGATEGASILHREGRQVLPVLLMMLVLNTLWWWCIRKGFVMGRWIEAAGTVGHFVGIGLLLMVGWNLMLPTVMFLPLGSITAAARFEKKWFYACIAFSVVVVGFAAADGYWQSRPAVAALALALLVGLPMTVGRLIGALETVSNAAIREFEEAVRARDAARNFLATMSHELRSPLNAMVNASELFSVDSLSESERELAETMRSNGRLLMRRVNDVLDVAALERGAMRLQKGTFNLRNAIDSVVVAVSQEADAKGLVVQVEVGPGMPAAVIGDVARFEQVLGNLVDNAVKYTPAGGKVSVGAYRVDDRTLQFAVRDTGIGIPDSEKKKVFEAHHQVSRGDARRYGGIGLGLHIVARLADLMKSRIWVEDNEGGGSVFRWEVPMEAASKEQAEASQYSSVAALDEFRRRHGKRRMLVIDDNASGREMIRRLLERAGQSVVVARNGEEGLAAIEAESFDLVLLDLHMPVMDGFAVLTAISTDRKRYGTPRIMVISAVSDDSSIKKAMSGGAKHFVTKPILPDALVAALEFSLSESGPADRH